MGTARARDAELTATNAENFMFEENVTTVK
jgi:hypothetical protein